jgi:hypothetical protein
VTSSFSQRNTAFAVTPISRPSLRRESPFSRRSSRNLLEKERPISPGPTMDSSSSGAATEVDGNFDTGRLTPPALACTGFDLLLFISLTCSLILAGTAALTVSTWRYSCVTLCVTFTQLIAPFSAITSHLPVQLPMHLRRLKPWLLRLSLAPKLSALTLGPSHFSACFRSFFPSFLTFLRVLALSKPIRHWGINRGH